MSSNKRRTVFVTVGTTLFESLIDHVTRPLSLQWMVENGYTDLIIQYGKGSPPTNLLIPPSLNIECYDFKASLQSDMVAADLIISHAGAGTVMECLRLEKRLVVVINTTLMHNHQTELASALGGSRRHLYVVHTPELLRSTTTWEAFEHFQPIKKERGDKKNFPRLLDSFLGFPEKES